MEEDKKAVTSLEHAASAYDIAGEIMKAIEGIPEQRALVWDLLRRYEEHAKRAGMALVVEGAQGTYGFANAHPVTSRMGGRR